MTGRVAAAVLVLGPLVLGCLVLGWVAGCGGGAAPEELPVPANASAVTFEGVPAGPYFVSVSVQVRGHDRVFPLRAIDVSKTVDIAPGAAVDFRFDLAGVELEGRLVNADGEPVGGMKVSFWSFDGERSARAEGFAASDGRFHLEGLTGHPGGLTVERAHVFFNNDGDASGRRFSRKRVDDVVPGTPGFVVVLDEAASVVARVDPIPAARVRFRYSNIEVGSGSDLDVAEDGGVRHAGLPPGIVTRVVFTCEGFAPIAFTGLVFEPGETRDLGTLTFTRGHAVEGRVVDEKGNVMRGVAVQTPEPWLRFRDVTLTTDAEGRFRVTGLPDRSTRLRFEGPRDHADQDVVVPDPGSAGPLLVRLTPGAVLRGTVRDTAGEPVVDASIYVFDFEPPGIDPDDDHRRWQKTAAKGRFGFRLVPGRYTLRRYRERGHVILAEVTLEEGDDVDIEVVWE